jgi:hypothetical protein
MALAKIASFITKITNYLKSGFPGLAVESCEEPRVMGDLLTAAKAARKGLTTWSITEGVAIVLPQPKKIIETQDVLAAIGALMGMENTLIVLRDAQLLPFDRDPQLARSLRDLLTSAPAKGVTVCLLGGKFPLYSGTEKLVQSVEYNLPTEADLQKVVAGIAKSCQCADDGNGDVLRALSGLSVSEAENALALSFVECGKFDPAIIYREKVAAVRKSGLLEIVEADPRGLDAIGGLGSLKNWIAERRAAYSPEAAEYGLPAPKGCLIVGVPGTGKSLAAKCFGTALGIPTLKLDMASLFGSLVGQSEQRCREALALAEAISPCVLWLDEMEKGLAGSAGSGSNDSGVTKRLVGQILTWMQERRRSVFLVATANDVSALPPELLRRGRFDEIWSVDLPSTDERAEIVAVQVAKHIKKVGKLDFAAAAATMNDFTGAEIEASIIASLYRAFADGKRPVTTDDVTTAASEIVPLATMARTQIDAIRNWAKQNARSANAPAKAQATGRRIG